MALLKPRATRVLVKGRGHDLHRVGGVAAEVGHLLGPLVDQQHDHVHVRMVPGDGVGDLLEDDRLAGAGWGHDQGPLAEAERRHEVDDTRLQDAGLGLEDDSVVGVQRREVLECGQIVQQRRVAAVDLLHPQQRKVRLGLFGRTNESPHDRALAQAEPSDLRGADVHVVGRRHVGVLGAAEKAEPVGQDCQRPLAHHQPLLAGPGLEDLENQLLLGQGRVVLDLLLLGDFGQLLRLHPLERRQAQFVLLGQLIPALALVLDRRRLGLELLVGGNLAGVQGDGHRRISRRGLLAPFAVFSRCHGPAVCARAVGDSSKPGRGCVRSDHGGDRGLATTLGVVSRPGRLKRSQERSSAPAVLNNLVQGAVNLLG
jgi:hypothetical protein